jgi:hypothetical protein
VYVNCLFPIRRDLKFRYYGVRNFKIYFTVTLQIYSAIMNGAIGTFTVISKLTIHNTVIVNENVNPIALFEINMTVLINPY